MATLTVYPDANPETISVDGVVGVELGAMEGVSWAELIAHAGNDAADSGDEIHIGFNVDIGNTWRILWRSILLFDTSSLPDSAVISSAVLSVYGSSKTNNSDDWLPTINVYSSNPASNTQLVAGDFDSLGSTPFCDTAIAIADWDTSGYNDFAFNTTGKAAISKTSVTKLGLREAAYDVGGSPPDYLTGSDIEIKGWSADEAEAGERRPKLVITYTVPSFTPKVFII